jgi:hypothetical protein
VLGWTLVIGAVLWRFYRQRDISRQASRASRSAQ